MSTKYWVDKARDLITIECRDSVDICDIASQILHIYGDPACAGVGKRLVDARDARVDGPVGAFSALVDLFVWQAQDLESGRIAIFVNRRAGMDWAHSLLELVEPRLTNVAVCSTRTDVCTFLNIQEL